jgi:hypothetical protein
MISRRSLSARVVADQTSQSGELARVLDAYLASVEAGLDNEGSACWDDCSHRPVAGHGKTPRALIREKHIIACGDSRKKKACKMSRFPMHF